MPCYRTPMKGGGTAFICGDLGDHCAAEKCADVSGFLCDYPVGKNKTCDLPLCDSHAYEVAVNVHYCPGHLALWVKFSDEGKVIKELSKVEAFNTKAFQFEINRLKQENKFLKERLDKITKPKPIKPK